RLKSEYSTITEVQHDIRWKRTPFVDQSRVDASLGVLAQPLQQLVRSAGGCLLFCAVVRFHWRPRDGLERAIDEPLSCRAALDLATRSFWNRCALDERDAVQRDAVFFGDLFLHGGD